MNNRQKMNIAMCMDGGYLMPSSVCMSSISYNNNYDIDFYIIHSGLTGVEIHFLEKIVKKANPDNRMISLKVNETPFDKSPTFGRSKEAYYRLLIPDLLPQNVDRCLYLDGDTLVTKDISSFYYQDFDSKAMVVCEDIGEILFFHKEQHSKLGIPTGFKYFNSGVLLFNLDYFRSKFSTSTFVNFIDLHKDLKFLDQDVLNGTCYDKVKFADSAKYNLMEVIINPMITNNAVDNASIIHFLQKPWRYNYKGANSSLWWSYAKQIYKVDYIKFKVLNTLYQKTLSFLTIFLPLKSLKRLASKK